MPRSRFSAAVDSPAFVRSGISLANSTNINLFRFLPAPPDYRWLAAIPPEDGFPGNVVDTK